MARHHVDTLAAADLAARLTELRDDRFGPLAPISLDLLVAEIYRSTGVLINRESLRRLWLGKGDPNSVALETLMAVARFFEVPPSALGPIAERRIRAFVALATGEEPIRPDALAGASTASGMVAASAGVVQRQNISFPS